MDRENNIGLAIKNARKKNRLTQEQLAELLNVTPAHVKHIESGRRKPSVEILFTAAKSLHFSLDALIDAEAPPAPTPIRQVNEMLADCNDRELRLISDIIKVVRTNR